MLLLQLLRQRQQQPVQLFCQLMLYCRCCCRELVLPSVGCAVGVSWALHLSGWLLPLPMQQGQLLTHCHAVKKTVCAASKGLLLLHLQLAKLSCYCCCWLPVQWHRLYCPYCQSNLIETLVQQLTANQNCCCRRHHCCCRMHPDCAAVVRRLLHCRTSCRACCCCCCCHPGGVHRMRPRLHLAQINRG